MNSNHPAPRVALVVLAAAAIPTAGASAATRKPVRPVATGTVYGGYTSQDDPFALKLTADRRHLSTLLLYVEGKCDDGHTITYAEPAKFAPEAPPVVGPGENVLVGGRLSPRGAFKYSGVATESYGDVVGMIKETVSGRIRAGRASGTYSATIDVVNKQSNAKVATCRTGVVKFLAISSPGRVYAGLTSQNNPVVVELNATRSKIDKLRIGWDTSCTSGGGYTVGDHFSNFAVRETGAFSDTWNGDFPQQDGKKMSMTFAVQGTLARAQARGTLSVKETDTDTGGATTDTCDTGTISWSARSSAKPAAGRSSLSRR